VNKLRLLAFTFDFDVQNQNLQTFRTDGNSTKKSRLPQDPYGPAISLLPLLSAPSSADQKSEFKEAGPGVSTMSSLISIIHQESVWSSEIEMNLTAKESKGRAQLWPWPLSKWKTKSQPLTAACGQ